MRWKLNQGRRHNLGDEMKLNGITFSNRAKVSEGDDIEKQNACFAMFAVFCKIYMVAKYVSSVDYTSNTCCFHINADQLIKFSEAHNLIYLAANMAFQQFELFDAIGGKGAKWEK